MERDLPLAVVGAAANPSDLIACTSPGHKPVTSDPNVSAGARPWVYSLYALPVGAAFLSLRRRPLFLACASSRCRLTEDLIGALRRPSA
eukprot:7203674-Alexandrium_andersonii.AAC.1